MASYKTDPHFPEIVKAIKSSFAPKKLYLFGSRTTEQVRPDSDYDFVVVNKRKKDSLDQMSDARDLIWEKCGVSADVFVYSQKEFDEWKDELSSIPETALNTGIEIDLG